MQPPEECEDVGVLELDAGRSLLADDGMSYDDAEECEEDDDDELDERLLGLDGGVPSCPRFLSVVFTNCLPSGNSRTLVWLWRLQLWPD